MEQYFSIGEMAKLHNISIETLRHYDRYNLLNPDYINEKTGYRYYSMKSFIKMDIIKKCKALGFTLDEIKETMEKYDSVDSILAILEKQKDIVYDKLKQLDELRQSIESLEKEIKSSLEIGINKIFIKNNEERKMIKYNYNGRYTKEFEINLRKTLVEVEKLNSNSNYQIVFEASYEKLAFHKELIYTETLIKIDNIDKIERETITLPKGKYLTLYFDDSFYETRKYYELMLNYIKENEIDIKGNFYEFYIITRANIHGEIKSLAQIEILI